MALRPLDSPHASPRRPQFVNEAAGTRTGEHAAVDAGTSAVLLPSLASSASVGLGVRTASRSPAPSVPLARKILTLGSLLDPERESPRSTSTSRSPSSGDSHG